MVNGPALLPITLRKVEAGLQVQTTGPVPQKTGVPMNTLTPQSDADIIAWYRRVQYYSHDAVQRKQARRDARIALPKPLQEESKDYLQSRMVSLLGGQPGVHSVTLPQAAAADPRPFEVVGVPLAPGFHVLEVASPDRPGLLARIGKVFVQYGVELQAAKIQTLGERVEDVFHKVADLAPRSRTAARSF